MWGLYITGDIDKIVRPLRNLNRPHYVRSGRPSWLVCFRNPTIVALGTIFQSILNRAYRGPDSLNTRITAIRKSLAEKSSFILQVETYPRYTSRI